VYDHIGGLDELERSFPAGVAFEIQRHRALVAIAREEERGHFWVVGMGAEVAIGIARKRLDLDDVGAEVAEHLAGIGTQDNGGHLDDANPFQRRSYDKSSRP
jgi:hypothetical protein